MPGWGSRVVQKDPVSVLGCAFVGFLHISQGSLASFGGTEQSTNQQGTDSSWNAGSTRI